MCANMGYNILLNVMIKALVLFHALFINAFIDKQGILQELSPMEFVLRWQLSWRKHCMAAFGSYCLTYNEPGNTVRNTMAKQG